MNEQSPLIYIIILNWNNACDTLECLASVAQLDHDNYRVLVMDNASTDGSVDILRSRVPDIEILVSHENLGYAAGNNVAIHHALQHGADYVLILNNDTLVAPSMLRLLLEAIKRSPDIAMVGPTMYCTTPMDKLFAAGSFVDWQRGDLCHRGMFQSPGVYVQCQDAEAVDFIVGCGVLVRREAIQAVGVYDPRYYLNFEDVEWAIRMKRHGYQILYVPQAVMWHKVSATLGQGSPANTYYMTRNALHFFWTNSPTPLRWLPVMQITARTIRTMAAWSIKPAYQTNSFRRKRQANWMALRDFSRGRFGKMGVDVAEVCYGS
jgi:GT2 family glycosyltransferase